MRRAFGEGGWGQSPELLLSWQSVALIDRSPLPKIHQSRGVGPFGSVSPSAAGPWHQHTEGPTRPMICSAQCKAPLPRRSAPAAPQERKQRRCSRGFRSISLQLFGPSRFLSGSGPSGGGGGGGGATREAHATRDHQGTRQPRARPTEWWSAGGGRPAQRAEERGSSASRTGTRRGGLWTTGGRRRCVGSTNRQTTLATFSTAPAHQRRGSANAETTPAGAPAAAADRTQRPDATCEGKSG